MNIEIFQIMINWKNIFTQFECMQTFGFVCRLTCSISCSSWWIIPFKRPWKRSCNKKRERERERLYLADNMLFWCWPFVNVLTACTHMYLICDPVNGPQTCMTFPCPVTVITMDKFSQHSAHRPTEVTLLNHTSNPIPLNPPNGAAARAMNFMLFCELCKSS